MSELFGSLREVKGTVENLGTKMDMNGKNLEDKKTDGFKTEGILRKQDFDDLEENVEKIEIETAKMEAGFKNEENTIQQFRKKWPS